MSDDDFPAIQQDELDFLLNFSNISDDFKEISFNEISAIKDKLNISEKQRTREESYEEIMKQIHHTKLEKIELAKQLEYLKQDLYHSYLGPFEDEFKELNAENFNLRKQLRKTAKKNHDDKSERYSNRSSIRMKASVKSTFGDENNKTNTKAKNRVSPNFLLVKKQFKLTESTSNLGRSQVQSPIKHRKRESQLTERKEEQTNRIGVSINISILDQKIDEFRMKESVSNNNLRYQNDSQKNVFLQILQNILREEKNHEAEKYEQVQEFFPFNKPSKEINNQVIFINEMEGQIKTANEKLEMLGLIIAKYQKQMEELNINLKNTEDWTKKLWSVKGKYLQMQRKCVELAPLRKEVSQKQQQLHQRKLTSVSEDQKSISSIQTMVKLLSSSSKRFAQTPKLYMAYYKQIKQLFKYDKQQQSKRYNKIIKVKETIDTIRQGRKKFNELINIYESRIQKLEQKINKVKANNQKR